MVCGGGVVGCGGGIVGCGGVVVAAGGALNRHRAVAVFKPVVLITTKHHAVGVIPTTTPA